jgi:hypothetical protein
MKKQITMSASFRLVRRNLCPLSLLWFYWVGKGIRRQPKQGEVPTKPERSAELMGSESGQRKTKRHYVFATIVIQNALGLDNWDDLIQALAQAVARRRRCSPSGYGFENGVAGFLF